LGPDGTRLRGYEAAAHRLFRSAWTKLEELRKERDEPLMPGPDCGYAPEPAARCDPPPVPPPAPAPPAATPVHPEVVFPTPALRGEPAAVLDFSVGGSPRPGMSTGQLFRDKTNPAPGRHAKRGRDLLFASLT